MTVGQYRLSENLFQIPDRFPEDINSLIQTVQDTVLNRSISFVIPVTPFVSSADKYVGLSV